MIADLVYKLFERILAADRRGAKYLIDVWARDHDYKQAAVELVEPAIRIVGESAR